MPQGEVNGLAERRRWVAKAGGKMLTLRLPVSRPGVLDGEEHEPVLAHDVALDGAATVGGREIEALGNVGLHLADAPVAPCLDRRAEALMHYPLWRGGRRTGQVSQCYRDERQALL